MVIKRNGHGWEVAWSKIIEGLVLAVVVALFSGGASWVVGIRQIKEDNKIIKRDLSLVCKQQKTMGDTLWNHLHPTQPCPWFYPLTEPFDYEKKSHE